MVIDILFMNLERSEAKEVLLAAYDLLGENEKGAIFRDSYGMAIKESPGHNVNSKMSTILIVQTPTRR